MLQNHLDWRGALCVGIKVDGVDVNCDCNCFMSLDSCLTNMILKEHVFAN